MKNIEISKSFLQSGNPLTLTSKLSCKHPTVREVLEIDKDKYGLTSELQYYAFVSVFLTDPYEYMVFLDDHSIDYEESTPFDTFILLFRGYMDRLMELESQMPKDKWINLFNNNLYYSAFRFFFGVEKISLAKDETGEIVLVDQDNNWMMNSELYDYVHQFIVEINGIPKTDKINPSDNEAKMILIEDERDRQKKESKKKKESTTQNRLGDLLSSVTWGSNGCVTPFNRLDLHMYDLIDGINRTDKMLAFKNTMTGYYSGCIDKKNINFEKLHWSS